MRIRSAAIAAAAFILGFFVVVGSRRVLHSAAAQPSSVATSTLEQSGGTELVLLYFGRSTCAWCNHPDLLPIVTEAKQILAGLADSMGWSFSTAGIAVDRDSRSGLDHLKELGLFDQVASGGGWLGLFGSPYLWEDLPGDAATPQVAVIRREIVREAETGGAILFLVNAQRVLTRKIGLTELKQWQQGGFVVPLVN